MYGPAFRRIVDAQVSDGRVLARVDATDTGIAASNHQAHPAVLDAALQCVALLAGADDASAGGAVVPAAVRHVRQFADLPDRVLAGVTRLAPRPGEAKLVADVVLTDSGRSGADRVTPSAVPADQPATAGAQRTRSAVVRAVVRAARSPATRPAAPRPWPASGCSWSRPARSRPSGPCDYATQRAPSWGHLPLAENCSPSTAAIRNRSVLEAEAELRRVLAADRDDTRPMVVTLVAATAADGQVPPSSRMLQVGELPAMLAGVARAVQNVQDAALLEGRELPMHGLVITRGALSVPGDREVPDLAASALVGARRVLRNEQPLLELAADRCRSRQPIEYGRPGVPGQRGLRE